MAVGGNAIKGLIVSIVCIEASFHLGRLVREPIKPSARKRHQYRGRVSLHFH